MPALGEANVLSIQMPAEAADVGVEGLDIGNQTNSFDSSSVVVSPYQTKMRPRYGSWSCAGVKTRSWRICLALSVPLNLHR
jgi:hypothetical protein